ncbi:MAG: anthranilate phosphoribosyltransferase [Pseudomonadales bacterium]|nr:anthranilate phosphoribosyltransferase [Pseudomonadales bacterium]
MTELKACLAVLAEGKTLSFEEARAAFEIIMSGHATPAQIAAFLMALRLRGESVDEISAAATVIRGRALAVKAPADAMDIVGTGGDGSGTLNISTATAFVVAACGVPVAKHGNRALSSKSGAADVLTALGINIDADFMLLEQAIAEANIGFMMAPRHHESFKYVGPVRVELGIRTIFNILGPLCNPAAVRRYLLGVFAQAYVRPMAEVLARLGCDRAWVVHGADGLDELSTTGSNVVCEVKDGIVTEFQVSPADAGIPGASLAELKGGDGSYNAQRLQSLLQGQCDAYRDIVLLNAAAALVVAERVSDLKAGVAMAARAIDTGRALAALECLKTISNSSCIL